MQHPAHLDFNHNFEASLHRMFEDINKPTNHKDHNQQSRNEAEIQSCKLEANIVGTTVKVEG